MSRMYEKVRRYYDLGLWKIGAVRSAVVKGWITAAEFAEITGEAY